MAVRLCRWKGREVCVIGNSPSQTSLGLGEGTSVRRSFLGVSYPAVPYEYSFRKSERKKEEEDSGPQRKQGGEERFSQAFL